MSYLIADTQNLSIYGRYTSEAKALRALTNAREKGWKIDGRKYHSRTLEGLSVMSTEEHKRADILVPVFNILNTDPNAKPVMIRRSQVGDPVHDPSTEGYHSM